MWCSREKEKPDLVEIQIPFSHPISQKTNISYELNINIYFMNIYHLMNCIYVDRVHTSHFIIVFIFATQSSVIILKRCTQTEANEVISCWNKEENGK